MTDLRRGLRRAPAGGWRTAVVREITHPTPRAVILRLDVPDRVEHWPGQHYVIRLTAENGYVAQRSYSIASAPSDPLLEFYVERLADGEVSGFLADVAEVGDELEIRGPIGGWFVWTAGTPMLAVTGGSGAVPIVSMLRHSLDVGAQHLVSAVVSGRTLTDLPYAGEFERAGAVLTLSRETSPSGRAAGRLSATDLSPRIPADGPCFVCGSTAFSGSATELLTGLGVDVARIRIERFGPSG